MSTPLEALKERIKPWTEPVSADAPAGRSAKSEAAYETVTSEVGKLEGLSGQAPRWDVVVQEGGGLLQKVSKDLLLASYVAYGLYQTQGLPGLATGVAMVAELTDGFWPGAFPEVTRIRGRVNALGWLVQRCAAALPATQVGAQDRKPLEELSAAVARLNEVVRARFEQSAPPIGPLSEAVERLKLSVPPEAPAAPPPPPPGAAPTPSAPAPAAAPAASAFAAAPVGELGSAQDASEFLRNTGSALISAAGVLRRADPADATAYRILRVGLWLHLKEAPPAGPGGKTSLPGLPAPLRTQLEKMAANGKWVEILEESESALTKHRFSLDLQRFSAQALGGLGDGHKAAREELLAQVRALLSRMPSLPKLAASDGSPLADTATQAWLDAEVFTGEAGGGGGGAGAAAGADADSPEAALAQARTLVGGGKLPEAMGLLQAKVQSARDARARFQLRLGLAQLCQAGGQRALALGLYEGLDLECKERDLDAWEPALAAACLEGLIVCLRQSGKAAPALAAELATRYHRLCRLDPAAALRVGA